MECLDYLDANNPLDFRDGDVSGSGSGISYNGDLGDDSGGDENGAGDGEGPNVVNDDSDDNNDLLVVGRRVRERGRGCQCCQVPVFVRIFTEIRPVIRSTEMQWLIPQI